MKVYTNSLNQICAVGYTQDRGLNEVDVTGTFLEQMPEAKILCYCVVKTGDTMSIYPYIDSNVVEQLGNVGKTSESISGSYDPTHKYVKDECCQSEGSLYRFKKDAGIGIPPEDKNYWEETSVANELNRILSMVKGENKNGYAY